LEKDKLIVEFQSNYSKANDFYKKDMNTQMVQFELLKNQKIKGQSEKGIYSLKKLINQSHLLKEMNQL
jgi:hypothetical protein